MLYQGQNLPTTHSSTSLNKIAADASDLGYINLGSVNDIDLESIYDLDLLNEVLAEKGLETIDNAGATNNVTNSTSSGEAIADIVA